jgi:hypothetical protein
MRPLKVGMGRVSANERGPFQRNFNKKGDRLFAEIATNKKL